MRILIYDPRDLVTDAASDLQELIEGAGCRADWFNGFMKPTTDYREWILRHERASKSRRWQRLASRTYDMFIGFDSASAVMAAALPIAGPKLGIVTRFESKEMHTKRSRVPTAAEFHFHVEIDLLRSFTELIAAPPFVRPLTEQGLTPRGFGRITELLTRRAAA